MFGNLHSRNFPHVPSSFSPNWPVKEAVSSTLAQRGSGTQGSSVTYLRSHGPNPCDLKPALLSCKAVYICRLESGRKEEH